MDPSLPFTSVAHLSPADKNKKPANKQNDYTWIFSSLLTGTAHPPGHSLLFSSLWTACWRVVDQGNLLFWYQSTYGRYCGADNQFCKTGGSEYSNWCSVDKSTVFKMVEVVMKVVVNGIESTRLDPWHGVWDFILGSNVGYPWHKKDCWLCKTDFFFFFFVTSTMEVIFFYKV